MDCLKLLREKEVAAANFNVLLPLTPYFTTLKTALPLLESVLMELNGDQTTSEEFQAHLIDALEKGNYSSKNLCSLMRTYCQTHNQGNVPEEIRKPVVGLGQQCHKILDLIDDILESMRRLPDHDKWLKHQIAKRR